MRFAVDERRWLSMLLLGMGWAAGVGCSRWRKDDVGTWNLCCEGVDSCLKPLQTVHGPDPGPEHGLPEEQQCAAWKLGMAEPAIVPRLIPLLSHADSRVRKGATYTLGLMHGKAESAVPALLASFEQEPRDDILGLASYPGQFEDSARLRLRALLKRELAEPVLRRPPDAVCPAPPASSCQVVFDGYRPAVDGPKGRVPIRAGTGPAPRCPEVTPRGKDWKLEGQTEALILQPVRDESSLELRGPCAGLRDAEYASIAAPLGEACLVGRDDGEFGGWLRVYEKASTTMLTGANPRWFLEVYGQAVVLSGLAHLGGSQGLIFRVERTAGGEWRAVPWVTLPGEPVAYGYDRRGDLVLATYPERPTADAEAHCFGQGLGYFDLVRVTRDGQLTQ